MIKWLLSKVFRVSKTKWTWRWYIISTRWFGVKVHWIRPVVDEWHTHPWNGFSIIFGSYMEQREGDEIFRRVWWFNKVGAHRPHRTRGNVLTIFFHGRRVNKDWYWDEETAPWRGPQDEVD